MIKLNVGCGPDIKPTDKGWVNIDGNQNEGVNLVLDLANQELPFPPNTVDHILAQNIIEHISRHKQKEFIQRLYDILKVGGTITIEMPNLKCIAERYLGIRTDGKEDLTTFDTAAFIFGAQEDDFGCHRWIYDFGSLQELLQTIGFVIYYMDEIRGTNLICKAIKPNWAAREGVSTIEDALFDCAISDSPYFIVESVHNKDVLVMVTRLSEFGRVFCYGDFPEFEHENIIRVSVKALPSMVYRSNGVIANDPGILRQAREYKIRCARLNNIEMDIEEKVEWITKQD